MSRFSNITFCGEFPPWICVILWCLSPLWLTGLLLVCGCFALAYGLRSLPSALDSMLCDLRDILRIKRY